MEGNATTMGFGSEERGSDTTIGPYTLLRQIGEGGMGLVYHAQQLKPIRRDVALKLIKPGMDTKHVIARFETERQALALMDHPNIAHVFDAGTTSGGRPYFVMELVSGLPITQYCDLKRVSVRERIELFIQVCEAIQHAHQKGVIHRDIKPSNILVVEHEGKPAPKVIDFGLAKALGQQLSDASMMTNVGVVVGTPDYMSPEQAELTRQDVDTRTDVYSLGAVLYELLTGTTPLKRERLENAAYVDVLQRIREDEPERPSTRLRDSRSSVDIELDWIIMKALDKDRTRRYETVSGLRRDLERYLAGEAVDAGPPSRTYRTRKFVRKHRVSLATAAAFVSLLIAASIVSASLAIRAGRAEEEARAVNDFLQHDLLAQASTSRQARPDTKPDPDLKVRAALDRAAMRIESRFGNQPLVEASIRRTIGTTYMDLGIYADAQRNLERALELRTRTLGERDLQTVQSMYDVATVLERQGKFANAESLYTRILEVQRRVLGDEDRETLQTMYSLASTFGSEGKYQEAETIYRTLLPIQRRVLGEDDVLTLESSGNLAAIYHLQNKYADAEPLYVKTIEGLRRVRGEEFPATLTQIVNLAELYRDEGKHSEAEPLYLKVLDIQRRIRGADHRDTLYTQNSLAELYLRLNRNAEAQTLFADTVEIARRSLGETHPRTMTGMSGLANAYRAQGRYAQAEALYLKALDLRRGVLGPDHPETVATLKELIRLYDLWEKPDKSAEWRKLLEKR